ncbi:hypothetical protein Q765_01885 [Flavobacterium rivuli WB 3.3-2 = DSM 21788]|uniref:GAF domain-containing protein n=1 Tax=Flavobacterium rivuli WB 3.3-2 = DSM 21788 TaxID=1121895 RepID=A0A0A2M8W0_9FLAO|nr:GAF domain-containing protein [Flavobacterium rivuli]KGO88674.1 hypothetical protein Q765_01885 [Flavobacterium rivuli WB 3.3-2 = DSM 21788]
MKKVITTQNPDEPHRDNYLEQERKILLELGKDITKVREKNDLIMLFSKRIKGLFYFTHTIVTLIDQKDETYWPFLLNTDASPIRVHTYYDQLVASRFKLNEPFINGVIAAEGPVSFMLEDVMDKPESPRFLKVNYEGGIKEILMTTLWNADKPMGFLHIYSDRQDSFTPQFRNIIKGIAPQLSNAVSNIIKNEELEKKENEKSFLLDFSNDIAAVRSKAELEMAVKTALRKINNIKGFVVRKINADGTTMSTYIHDDSVIPEGDPIMIDVGREKFPIYDGLQSRVLESYIPLLFSVDIEIERGVTSAYLFFWKRLGYKRMVGIALRNGETNLGILWLGYRRNKYIAVTGYLRADIYCYG